jgi:hypothetical protein
VTFFDPDRNWKSPDKAGHAAAGFVAAMFFGLFASPLAILGLVLLAGAAFELGQWDATRNLPGALQPGHGFGLLDLAADLAGALVYIGLVAVV